MGKYYIVDHLTLNPIWFSNVLDFASDEIKSVYPDSIVSIRCSCRWGKLEILSLLMFIMTSQGGADSRGAWDKLQRNATYSRVQICWLIYSVITHYVRNITKARLRWIEYIQTQYCALRGYICQIPIYIMRF